MPAAIASVNDKVEASQNAVLT